MPAHAYERVKRGLPMPGVIEIKRMAGVGEVLEILKMVIEVSQPEEWENQVKYFP
jgi:hypothetical protein